MDFHDHQRLRHNINGVLHATQALERKFCDCNVELRDVQNFYHLLMGWVVILKSDLEELQERNRND